MSGVCPMPTRAEKIAFARIRLMRAETMDEVAAAYLAVVHETAPRSKLRADLAVNLAKGGLWKLPECRAFVMLDPKLAPEPLRCETCGQAVS
jgi:hypothetical protein